MTVNRDTLTLIFKGTCITATIVLWALFLWFYVYAPVFAHA